MGRTLHVVREAVLTALAVAGALCILVAVASTVLGIRPLVVRSNSMAPDIPVGSLALARQVSAADVEPGDVVSVVRADGRRVTHRVVSAAPAEARWRLVLRGDANEASDQPDVVRSVDRVFWSEPSLGRVAVWLGSRRAAFLFGLAGGALVALALGAARPRARHAAPT